MSDTMLRDGIANDHLLFDNKVSITIEHVIASKFTNNLNFVSGTFEAGVEIQVVNDCLFRGLNYRTVGSIKQITDRMASVQKDEIPKIDSVVEIPTVNQVHISAGDKIINNDTKEEWRVVSIDLVTLLNRLRVGVSKYA